MACQRTVQHGCAGMIRFPSVTRADPSGLLCISDDMDATLLWSAYCQGVFPWTDRPVGWFAPPSRGLLRPAAAHFPKNVAKLWRKAAFQVTFDTAFADVIAGCRASHADEGEWITPRFVAAYCALFEQGHAHSVEVWQSSRLVGGTYGVQVGHVFSAESMFGVVSNASRSALYALVCAMAQLQLVAIDVQVVGEVTAALGATAVARAEFMRLLAAGLTIPGALAPKRWPTRPFGDTSATPPTRTA